MNREISFRGQTRKKGEFVNVAGEPRPGRWVFGGIFAPHTDSCAIIYGVKGENAQSGIQCKDLEKFVVHRDTVGQFTGLYDKNGTKIFEGDIVQENSRKHGIKKHRVIFDNYHMALMLHELNNPISSDTKLIYSKNEYEIIGNIHDNPEQLEVQ